VNVEEGEPDTKNRAFSAFHDCNVSDNHSCVNYSTLEYYTAGGLYIEGSEGGGTAGCRVYNNYFGEERIITAAHLWFDVRDDPFSDCSGDPIGEPATNYADDKMGEVEKYSLEDDWAIIEPESNVNVGNHIDRFNDLVEIGGYVSESQLDSWASAWFGLKPCFRSMGTSTSVTGGKIKNSNFAYDASGEDLLLDCISYEADGTADGVYTYCDIAGGDSGGPTWHKEDGKAWITNLNTSGHVPDIRTTCGNLRGQDSSGIAAYEIAGDNLWVDFPGPSI